MRYFRIFVVLSAFLTNLFALAADETHASEDFSKMQGDAEIRQKIIGTWVVSGSFTYTNSLESYSRALTYGTNGYYSATQTIDSDGRTCVKKCEGMWSLKNAILTYSITNCIGVQPTNSGAFFFTQARVINVNSGQLRIFEGMDRFAFFERDSTANKR